MTQFFRWRGAGEFSLFFWWRFDIIKNPRIQARIPAGAAPWGGACRREVDRVNKKLSQLLAPRFWLYLLVMAAFSVATLLLGRADVAVAELAAVAVLAGVEGG